MCPHGRVGSTPTRCTKRVPGLAAGSEKGVMTSLTSETWDRLGTQGPEPLHNLRRAMVPGEIPGQGTLKGLVLMSLASLS